MDGRGQVRTDEIPTAPKYKGQFPSSGDNPELRVKSPMYRGMLRVGQRINGYLSGDAGAMTDPARGHQLADEMLPLGRGKEAGRTVWDK